MNSSPPIVMSNARIAPDAPPVDDKDDWDQIQRVKNREDNPLPLMCDFSLCVCHSGLDGMTLLAVRAVSLQCIKNPSHDSSFLDEPSRQLFSV
ncbi:hypothetical protein PoB_002520200 [Plakobranchus ocellatus]|uniref:Uncharacterized protein n=1 Tax=Plakobranchus ocellatus TaxID=259542 RepID=A0AAV3ZVK5_9GAST|nr:hypothetical protein PoB_002520200 [Plakobranchus ocellatus]